MKNTMIEHKELDAYIASLPITYSAEFVPQSKSRNAGDKNPSLNWKVTLTRNHAATLTTDYMQGIAHAPGYEHAFAQGGHKDIYFLHVAEKGRTLKVLPEMANKRIDWYEANERMSGYGMGLKGKWNKSIPTPLLRDVLYSLIMDSSVIDHANFESWASDFGYDVDSRSAEKIYKKCLDIALQLRGILGNETIEKLQELFKDY